MQRSCADVNSKWSLYINHYSERIPQFSSQHTVLGFSFKCKNDPKKGTSEDISDFKVLHVLFGGLVAFPVALKSSWKIKLKYFAITSYKKNYFFIQIFF
jgi:hypothetical protein